MKRLVIASFVLALLLAPSRVRAQDPEDAPVSTVFPHPDDVRWWLSGQINLIEQFHGSFTSPYEGEHSLRSAEEQALSRVWTLYTGWQLSHRVELFFDLESAGGRGLSDALGLAGFTNLDVVRNPDLGASPYLARLMIRYVLPLSRDEVDVTRGPLALGGRQPRRRLEIRAGKLSLADFFDINGPGSDSHLQFTNWTVDNNGAYDYAADTRGYTYGLVVEFINPSWTLRGAEALMPKVANGIDLDWNPGRARGENLELEWRPGARLVSRTLGYANRANMGSYDEAIAAFQAGIDARPDIEAHREQGRVIVRTIARDSPSSPMGCRILTASTSGWAGSDSCSATERCATDARRFSRRTTRRACGGACSAPWALITSATPATTATGDRSLWVRPEYT